MPFHAYGWVLNAIEHGCFYSCVVYHVLEYDFVANIKPVRKQPISHEISAEAAVSSKAENVLIRNVFDFIPQRQRTFYFRLIRHFKTIGHMAGKADV